jgi:hypothetical protein
MVILAVEIKVVFQKKVKEPPAHQRFISALSHNYRFNATRMSLPGYAGWHGLSVELKTPN